MFKTSLLSSKRDDLFIKFHILLHIQTPQMRYKNTLILHFNMILPQLINKQVCSMGDFNTSSPNYDSHTPTFDFMNILLSNNFLPCITLPTRITINSAITIDNIFAKFT